MTVVIPNVVPRMGLPKNTALFQIGDTLEGLAGQNMQRNDSELMGKVFALNPTFGQALYGAKNNAAEMAMKQDEMRRKLAQQRALKQLAGELGNINVRDPVQRQSALARYAEITGDLEPMFGLGSSGLPAAIQIANEIAARRAAGDFEGAKLLEQSAKLGEKGTYTDPQTGEIKVLPGYVPAVSKIEGAKADASNISDMTYDPLTAGLSEQAKLKEQLETQPKITTAQEAAKERGAAQAKLESMQASLPNLGKVTQKLSALGKAATFTLSGRAFDAVSRELGGNVPEGAVARKEYIATVDNEVLPLLRQTFGAAFTVEEGNRLRETLGDANASPQEKDAVLRAFIESKKSEIDTLQRQVSGEITQPAQQKRKRFNPATGKIE